MVSDTSREIGKAYGTLREGEAPRNDRDTVVVGRDGTVLVAYEKVQAKGHAATVLADLRWLREAGGF